MNRPFKPILDKRGEPRVRRFEEQRWLIDNVIRANGIDWDQPRSLYLNGPCGSEANADFAGIRERVKKMADIGPAFEAVARRREAKARDAEAAGHKVTARDNYFMAAVHWGAAQWPYDENDATNIAYNNNKRDCFTRYAGLADHRVEPAWVPLGNRAIPAWLHLPPGYAGGRIPAVIAIPGMDSFKEIQVALYGDRFLNRGMAVLAIDGPGQYEAPMIGLYFSVESWMAAGKALVDWLGGRPEIDPEHIGCSGTSFGTLFGTILTAHEPRIRAFAAMSVCHEPGGHTIFQQASPTFKKRFMYMSGITDEDEFDRFRRTITWEGHAEKIRVPYLVVAGECEELSPLEHSERLIATLKGPKQMVVYQESRHSVGNVPAANLGPFPPILVADWLADRLAGKPFANEHWFVRSNGQIDKRLLSCGREIQVRRTGQQAAAIGRAVRATAASAQATPSRRAQRYATSAPPRPCCTGIRPPTCRGARQSAARARQGACSAALPMNAPSIPRSAASSASFSLCRQPARRCRRRLSDPRRHPRFRESEQNSPRPTSRARTRTAPHRSRPGPARGRRMISLPWCRSSQDPRSQPRIRGVLRALPACGRSTDRRCRRRHDRRLDPRAVCGLAARARSDGARHLRAAVEPTP